MSKDKTKTETSCVKFYDIVKNETPRVVVMFRRDGDKELFQWGMVGGVPILALVGQIVRVQAELAFRKPEECPESALVIAYIAESRKFDWFVHPDIPVESLVGMLETIKVMILDSHMAKQIGAQKVQLLGPDGQPMRA